METTTLTFTSTEEMVTAGAVVGAVIGALLVGALIFYILTVIAAWKMFKKAGEPGWKAIIPIYNMYIMYKIVGMAGWFWGSLLIGIVGSIILAALGFDPYASEAKMAAFNSNPIVAIMVFVSFIYALVMQIVYANRTSKAFGHGIGFAIGIFFFTNIFWLILGFGNSKYNKKVALKK